MSKRVAKCLVCGAELHYEMDMNGKAERDDMGQIIWRDEFGYVCERVDRGQKNYGLRCHHCEGLLPYSTENETEKGTAKAYPYTYGIELECSVDDFDVAGVLQNNDYMRTSDCTVKAEYKSPIMEGLASISKMVDSLDEYADLGKFSTDDTISYKVGTHVNIGMRGKYGRSEAEIVRRYYHSLFTPLCEAISENGVENSELIFGRYFGDWARPINGNSDCWAHANFINVTKDVCIEFRICKYHAGNKGGKQFISTIKTCRKIFAQVLKAVEEIKVFDYNGGGTKRKAIAKKYGERIAKIYTKQCN